MGKLFYWLTLKLYIAGLYLAKPFSEKAQKMLEGRENIWLKIEEKMRHIKGPVVWFHCASLGEFEQGRPVIEKIKEDCGACVVVTFFSPSGFEVRKNYANADAVFYLPFDSAKNAKTFISAINPALAYFVKYEFWHYYLKELQERGIPVMSISTIFRPGQLFFKPYGQFYRSILSRFDHFFVQNSISKELLGAAGLSNAEVSGDTRFDRVHQVCSRPAKIALAEKFKAGGKVFVIGSSWPNDIETIAPFMNRWIGKLKFIIAPHELSEKNLAQIERLSAGKVIRFSKADLNSVADCDVLLVDNIGMLSSLYSYGEYAYVGGAFGGGLHNTLEAAAYGVPVFFGRGKKNIKYQEAVDLIAQKAAFEIGDWKELDARITELYHDPEKWQAAANASANYIVNNLGATEKIISYSAKYLEKL